MVRAFPAGGAVGMARFAAIGLDHRHVYDMTEGLLEAGVEIRGLYTYPQGADEQWFTPPAAVAQSQSHANPLQPEHGADPRDDISDRRPFHADDL